MKRILLIIPYGGVGGMERLALTFFDFYQSRGYVVKVVKLVCLPDDIINFEHAEFALSRKDLDKYSFAERMLFYLKIPFLLRKIIKSERITHSISFGDMANMFSAITLTKEFKIASIHAIKSVELLNRTFLNRLFRLSYRTSYGNFHKVVCISKAIKTDLIKKCGFTFVEKLEVIYNPHHISQLRQLASAPIDSVEEQNIFLKPVVIFVGRMSMQKAPWHLVKSFSLLIQSGLQANLVFVGDGDSNVEDYVKHLAERYDLKDRVFYLGRKSNPYPYIKKANVLALSSYYEGTPNVIVEAICLDVPVVASWCTDGIIELMSNEEAIAGHGNIYTEVGIVTPNFFKGILGIPKDTEFTSEEKDMATALSQVLQGNDVWHSDGPARKEILKKFNLERIAETYLRKIQ
jgi:glycosyltransferase involved in cell wall biosynthesis